MSCEAARENSQQTSTNYSFISLHFKPLFLVFMSILLKAARSQMLLSGKYVSAMMALFYLCLRKVGTEFSHETAASSKKGSLRIGSQIHIQSLILIRSTHVVANCIYLAERDRPNLR